MTLLKNPALVPSEPAFRSDINALRALAVIAVVLYHFRVEGFSGGYVGVDVFFVISGFLMTGIIVKGLESKKFSVLDFYFSRVRRILPALIVLCVLLLVIGWIMLAPDDYSKLAEHAKDTLLFISNNTYRKESGYFDAESHEKWLLHTWSLSVEWQFYLWLPVILWCAWKIHPNRIFMLFFLIFLTCISFYSCIEKAQEAPTKAFYILKYRYWEMLFGGCLYLIPNRFARAGIIPLLLRSIGMILILGAIFSFSPDTAWPGILTIVPVFGAFLFIFSKSNNSIFIDLSVLQWIGGRSYSIYLWHWPIVVFLAYFQKSGSNYWVFVGVMITLLLGEISYRFVECPFKNGFGIDRRLYPVLVIVVAACVCLISLFLINGKGIPSRVVADVANITAEKSNRAKSGHDCVYDTDKNKGPLSCIYGTGSVAAIVLGDSHASAVVTAVQSAANNPSASIYLWSRAACPFIRGVTAKIDQDCDSFVNWVVNSLESVPADVPLIIVERWSLYPLGANEGVVGAGVIKPPVFFDKPSDSPDLDFLREFKVRSVNTICEISKERRVYLVKPVPEMKVNVPQVLARWKMMGLQKRIFISINEYSDRHQFILGMMEDAKKQCGVKILDPLPYLCDSNKCFGDDDGWPLYFDDDHLSEYGNKLLIPMFSRVFDF
jgi:peptidoglycan/LPS O-acetylase OafA/YrhL